MIFLMVMQKFFGILSVCLRRRGGLGVKNIEVWNRAPMVKHLWSICNPSKSTWISSYLLCGRFFGRFARKTNHGAGERFSVFVVWFENLSTFALEMGVLDANLVITWSRNPHAKTSIPEKPSTSVLIGV